jgi:hypothetical protein
MVERSSGPYKIPFLIGIVGHRDLTSNEIPAIRAAIKSLLSRLMDSFPDIPVRLLTSMADGADLLGAEVAAELGIPITALLPMPAAVCREDIESAENRASFDRVVAQAEQMLVAMPADTSGKNGAEVTSRFRRDLQFQRAGVLVARYSTLLIAVWDGKETDHRAGTARVVECRRRGIELNGDDEMPIGNSLLAIQDNDLMYEIRCSRRSDPQHRDDSPSTVQVRGFVGANASGGDRMPESLAAVLRRIGEFNRDVDQFSGPIEAEGRRLSHASPHPLPERLGYLDQLFRAADWLGGHYHRSFTFALRTRYTLWAVMAFLLVSFKKESFGVVGTATILGVLTVFALGFVFARLAHQRSWHRKYLDYRALAEGLRVEYYWGVAGVHSSLEGGFAHETFLQKQDVELEWIRVAMRAVSLQHAVAGSMQVPGGFEQAFANWVGDDDLINGSGQLLYYRQRIHRYERRLHNNERLEACLLFAGLFLALAFGAEMVMRWAGVEILPTPLRNLMLWGLALLPVYAVIFDTYVGDKMDRVLIRQYRYMYSLFGIAARELRMAKDQARKIDVLRSLGYACLAEHAQWILGNRQKRIEGLRW